MLNILEASNEELTTLEHGPKVFHDALAKVRRGSHACDRGSDDLCHPGMAG